MRDDIEVETLAYLYFRVEILIYFDLNFGLCIGDKTIYELLGSISKILFGGQLKTRIVLFLVNQCPVLMITFVVIKSLNRRCLRRSFASTLSSDLNYVGIDCQHL